MEEVSPNHYEVSRKALQAVASDPAGLSRAARVIPQHREGRLVGVKLFGIRRSSVLGSLGLQNGDLLLRINGEELTTSDKALDLYEEVRRATHVRVDIERHGRPQTLSYDLVP